MDLCKEVSEPLHDSKLVTQIELRPGASKPDNMTAIKSLKRSDSTISDLLF
jgi:hypothetical protein